MLILYVDETFIISHSKSKIQHEILSLKKDYDLTDNGELQNYIGTRFDRCSDGSVTLAQHRMIKKIMAII